MRIVKNILCIIVIFYLIGNYRKLCEFLNGFTETLKKHVHNLDNVLETLDKQQHSLGVLYILVTKFSNISVSYKNHR